MTAAEAFGDGGGGLSRHFRGVARGALSVWAVLLVFLLWAFGGAFTRFVPSVAEVAEAFPGFVTDSATWVDVGITLRRVVLSLFAAVVLGLGAAYLMYRQTFAGQVVSIYVRLALGLPSTIAALLALFIFRRSPAGVYVVVTVITFPFIVLTLLGGMQAADRSLDEMAKAYRFGVRRHLRHVTVPHLVPYMFSAIRNENAHAWRVVVLAEVFAVSSGMGARFTRAFDRFILVDVLLWLFAFMAILLATEYVVLRPIERSVLRWRRAATTTDWQGMTNGP